MVWEWSQMKVHLLLRGGMLALILHISFLFGTFEVLLAITDHYNLIFLLSSYLIKSTGPMLNDTNLKIL